MSEYIYEIELGSEDFKAFLQKLNDLSAGVFNIVENYKDELLEKRINFDTSYGMDIVTGTIKIKPIQEDLPEQMKIELHEYFRTKSLQL